ncbi:MAG: hypothetical protein HKN07_07880 [Acidimicrobiia bacterium]|nr:hypothetical protein [Acidimicrobiia bacterium]
MRNRINTAATAAAVAVGLTGVAIAGGLSAAAADPGDGSGTTTEWCDEYGNHERWNTEEHEGFHNEMESHMGDFMGMGMGMGMTDGFDFDDMGAGSEMGDLNMGRGPFMDR